MIKIQLLYNDLIKFDTKNVKIKYTEEKKLEKLKQL